MIRGLRPAALLGTVAQVTQGVTALSMLLVGHAHHLAVSTSALAVAAAALGMAITRPAQGIALDRLSPRTVFAGFGLAHGAVFVLVAVAAQHRWPVMFVLTGLAVGLSLPPIATLMRADWPGRVDADRATAMFAFIASLQMASVLIAPVVFTVLNALAGPTAAMLSLAVCAAIGTVLFGVVSADARVGPGRAGRIGVRRYLVPLVLTVLFGAVVGAVQVAAPALAIAAGRPGLAGLLVATSTVGALFGSFVAMGRWGRRLATGRLLTYSAGCQVVGAVVVVLPLPLAATFVGMLLLGLGDAPALAALSASIAQRARGTAESFGWQSTAQGVGMAGGSAVAGVLAAAGAHLSALPALLCALACAVAGLRLRPDAAVVSSRVATSVASADL